MKRLFVFVVVLVLLAVMVSSVSVAGASASQAVSGTWQVGSISALTQQPVGGSCIIEAAITLNWQGDLEGISTDHIRIMHLGPCDQPASEVFGETGTFQGTANGISGSFDLRLLGYADAQGNIQGQLFILTGTGGLANLHGGITLTGPLFPGGTYSGHIRLN
jgi:hypothetical protein